MNICARRNKTEHHDLVFEETGGGSEVSGAYSVTCAESPRKRVRLPKTHAAETLTDTTAEKLLLLLNPSNEAAATAPVEYHEECRESKESIPKRCRPLAR